MKGFNLGFQPTFRGKGLIACYPYFNIHSLLLFQNILNSFSDFTYASEVRPAQRGSTFNWFDGRKHRAVFSKSTFSDVMYYLFQQISYSFRSTRPYFEQQSVGLVQVPLLVPHLVGWLPMRVT